MAKKTPPSFEQALEELEQIIGQMEQGEISLEESLKSFERGIHLTRTCQQALRDAEQKVQQLVEKSGVARLEPLERDQD